MLKNPQSVSYNGDFQTWGEASSGLKNILFKLQKALGFSYVALGTQNRHHSRTFSV